MNIINNKISFELILNKWLYNKKNEDIKESTYVKYFNTINQYIIPYLGNISFKKLSSKDINLYFNNYEIDNLSNSTKNLILIIIKSSINYGINNIYKRKNIDVFVKIQKPIKSIKYFSVSEQKTLEKYLKTDLNIKNISVLLALYTGLRIGELCSLRWENINFINNTIYVNHTVQRIKDYSSNTNKTKLIISKPKTNSSIRNIPLPKFLSKLLYKFKSNDEYFILSNSLKPKDPRSVEKYFTSITQKCKINNLSFHALRHTYATRLREKMSI